MIVRNQELSDSDNCTSIAVTMQFENDNSFFDEQTEGKLSICEVFQCKKNCIKINKRQLFDKLQCGYILFYTSCPD